MISYRVSYDGSLFNGVADRLLVRMQAELEKAIATRAEQLISERLDRVLRHPTGFYQSQIAVRREGGHYVVNDNDVIYGPWLEGVGSRNQTTRFKGYATFRKVTQLMERQSTRIGERMLDRYARRM